MVVVTALVVVHPAPSLVGGAFDRMTEAGNEPVGDKCPLDPFMIVPDQCEYVDHQVLKLQVRGSGGVYGVLCLV